MKEKKAPSESIVFSPGLRADDPRANYWMRQATLRVRREIAWIWHERGATGQPGELPPCGQPIQARSLCYNIGCAVEAVAQLDDYSEPPARRLCFVRAISRL